MKDLPIYDITVEDDKEIQGVSKISLVDVPAIGVNWIALKKQPKMLLATPECFGCPPNGDGTRVDGEPDGRCSINDGPGGGGPKGSTIPKAVPPVDVDYGQLNKDFTQGNEETDIVNRYFLKPPGEVQTGFADLNAVVTDGSNISEFKMELATGPDGYVMEYRDPNQELDWSGEDATPWNSEFEKSLTESQSAPMPDFYEAITWEPPYAEELNPNDPEDAADYALYQDIQSRVPLEDENSELFRQEIFQETKYEEQRALYNTSMDAWEDDLRAKGFTYESPGDFLFSGEGGAISYDKSFYDSGEEIFAYSPNPEDYGGGFDSRPGGPGVKGEVIATDLSPSMISKIEPNIQVLNLYGQVIMMPQSVAQRIYIGHDTEIFATTPTGNRLTYRSESPESAHGTGNLGAVVGFRQIQNERGETVLQVGYGATRTVNIQGAKNQPRPTETVIYRDVYGSNHRLNYPNYENNFEPVNQPRWSKVPTDQASFLRFKKMLFSAVPEKKMLYGPFLIPNKLIYRRDDINGEYYVRFSAEEIKKIAEKFNEQLKNKEINLMHTDEAVDAFVAENWVTDGKDDKSKTFGFDLPQGTWFGGVKIKNDKFWTEEVKSEKVKGFSVEILANLELKMIKKIKEESMKKNKKIDLGSVMLGDGTTPIYFDGETIAVGTKIFTDEAMTMPAKDDRWVLQDGSIIVVLNGEVTAIEDQTLMAEPAAETETVDKMAACVANQMARYGDEAKAKSACEKMMGGKKEEKMEAPVGAPAVQAPQAQSLTAEEVTLMIDSRYQELMDEISALKSMMGDKEKEYEEYKKQVSEKFSMSPSETSIKKDVAKTRFNDKFSEMEAKVRAFAKVK
jgi:hypothetical protein